MTKPKRKKRAPDTLESILMALLFGKRSKKSIVRTSMKPAKRHEPFSSIRRSGG